MTGIILSEVTKSYGNKNVLERVNLEVLNGELLSLLGPSGCGKTTTLRVIGGLLSQDSGTVKIGGEIVDGLATEKRGAVIVFQEHLLFPHMNIEKNIGFGLKMKGVKSDIIKNRVSELLEQVELIGLENRYPSQISGGQRQRVALARALAVEPRVLLLDEPFSSLDIRLREEMRKLTVKLQKEHSITTILVTHDIDEALSSSDRVAVMVDGKILQTDTPCELYENPNCIAVATFLGESNFLEGTVKGGVFHAGGLKLPCPNIDHGLATLMLKPEAVKIVGHGDKPLSGNILSREYSRTGFYYEIDTALGVIRVYADKMTHYNQGESVEMDIDIGELRYFC